MFLASQNTSIFLIQMVPIRIPRVLLDYVRKHGLPDLSGCRRSKQSAGNNQAVLDIPCPVGLDIYCRHGYGLGGTVQLRLLQPHADIAADWTDYHGAFSSPFMVYLLPDGNYDAACLQGKGREKMTSNKMVEIKTKEIFNDV